MQEFATSARYGKSAGGAWAITGILNSGYAIVRLRFSHIGNVYKENHENRNRGYRPIFMRGTFVLQSRALQRLCRFMQANSYGTYAIHLG